MIKLSDIYTPEVLKCPFCGKQIGEVGRSECLHFEYHHSFDKDEIWWIRTRYGLPYRTWSSKICVTEHGGQRGIKQLADAMLQDFNLIVRSLAPVLLAEFAKFVPAAFYDGGVRQDPNDVFEYFDRCKPWLPIAIEAVLGKEDIYPGINKTASQVCKEGNS